jgi:hypothetical protein
MLQNGTPLEYIENSFNYRFSFIIKNFKNSPLANQHIS